MTTLFKMAFSPDYEELKKTFDLKAHLLPPDIHTQVQDATNAYKQFGRVFALHITKRSKTDVGNSPRKIAQHEVSMQQCGFYMLFKLFKKLSPQLGGSFRDLQDFVTNLQIKAGEPVLDFYLRTFEMSQ